MCGRFSLRVSSRDLAEFFELNQTPELALRPDIRPTQLIPAIVFDSEIKSRRCDLFRWGLVPAWSKDPKSGAPLINARSESAATKPAFRNAFRQRRCLIPADGFYEWKSIPGRKKKQPYYISLRESPLLGLAGLWGCWQSGQETLILSCTILTTQANAAMATLHDRMPVILPQEQFEEWLDPNRPSEELSALLRPSPPEEMVLSAEMAEELLSDKPSTNQQLLF